MLIGIIIGDAHVDSGELQDGWTPIVISKSNCNIIAGKPSWTNSIVGIEFEFNLNNTIMKNNVIINVDNLRQELRRWGIQ